MIVRCAAVFAAVWPLSMANARVVFIGTQSEAIWAAQFNPDTGALTVEGPAAPVARPTWLTIDRNQRRLFAVSETGNNGHEQGEVVAFAVAPDGAHLHEINRVPSGGGGPTYLSYAPDQHLLLVGNFGGGAVSVVPVAGNGALAPPVSIVIDPGPTGPHPKQAIPHAHAAQLMPGGRFVLVPDMGTDKVNIYRFDRARDKLSPAAIPSLSTGSATGPRHLAVSGDGRFVYLVTELKAQLRILRWNGGAGSLVPVDTVALDPPDERAEHSAAEVRVSRDDRFVYVSNRIRSTIEVFRRDRHNGTVRLIQSVRSGGDRPRSFAIDPSGRWMLVGNQNSSSISVMRINQHTGLLTLVGAPVALPAKPVCFDFLD